MMLFGGGRRLAALRSGPFASGLSKRSVFIQMEKTPNPSSLKFLPSQAVLPDVGENSAGYHFSKKDKDYLRSPLAAKLLSIEEVTSVFLGKDFVTVSKTEEAAWQVIKPFVFSHIMDWFAEGTLAVEDEVRQTDTTILDDDSEVVAMIKELVEARIRPAVQEDGGDIFYRGFDEVTGIVSVELAGSCVGCPSSSVTLRNGVENMLMHYIPEVKGIQNVEPEGQEEESFKLSFPQNNDTTPTTADEDDASSPTEQKKDDPRVSI